MGKFTTAPSSSRSGELKYLKLASATFPVPAWASCRALTIFDDQEKVPVQILNLLVIAAAK